MDLVKIRSFESTLFLKLELEILYMLLKPTFHMKNLDIFLSLLPTHRRLTTRRFYERHGKTENTVHKFHIYSSFSGLKLNLTIREVADVEQKGVELGVRSMQCVNLNTESIKILGNHFSYKKKLREKKSLIAS